MLEFWRLESLVVEEGGSHVCEALKVITERLNLMADASSQDVVGSVSDVPHFLSPPKKSISPMSAPQ